MKVAVIGAGIVGVTTAYELAADGHEVTVLERRSSVAEEASFANAGVVAPGYVTPWAAPGMPGKVFRHLLRQHAPVRLAWPLALRDLVWTWKWLGACKPGTYLANRAQLQQLAVYSRERLRNLGSNLQLEYDRSAGYMVLLRSQEDAAMVQPGLQVLREAGVAFRQIEAAEALKLEPALNPDLPFAGAVYLPDDEVGNCRQFALLLKAEAQRQGVKFEFNTTVALLDPARPASVLIAGEQAARHYDAVVMCAGLASAQLLQPLGVHLPMVAVYGYSITAPVRELYMAPRSAVMDERYKVAVSRLGNRIRVAGGAEIGGSLANLRAAPIRTLYKVLNDWFPGAVQLSSAAASVQVWKGARPMLPDGPPIVGGSGLPGLWLNLGHGSSGWALSCGSARVIADLLAGKAPDIDTDGLRIERLGLRA